jgi:Domain of unknown function (DUF4160)
MNPYEEIENKVLEAETLAELEESLEELLNSGFGIWTDGDLYSIRKLVDRVNGLKIEIFPNEHPPPHFHVRNQNISAAFSIQDCRLIEGQLDGSSRALIEWWHKGSKNQLVKIWNDMRPSDCPVGRL